MAKGRAGVLLQAGLLPSCVISMEEHSLHLCPEVEHSFCLLPVTAQGGETAHRTENG